MNKKSSTRLQDLYIVKYTVNNINENLVKNHQKKMQKMSTSWFIVKFTTEFWLCTEHIGSWFNIDMYQVSCKSCMYLNEP